MLLCSHWCRHVLLLAQEGCFYVAGVYAPCSLKLGINLLVFLYLVKRKGVLHPSFGG